MVDINLIIGLGGFVLAVATFFIGRMTGAKADGREIGEIKTLLNCTKDTIERVEKSLNIGLAELGTKVDVLEKDVTKINESVKSAHKRIDEIIHKR